MYEGRNVAMKTKLLSRRHPRSFVGTFSTSSSSFFSCRFVLFVCWRLFCCVGHPLPPTCWLLNTQQITSTTVQQQRNNSETTAGLINMLPIANSFRLERDEPLSNIAGVHWLILNNFTIGCNPTRGCTYRILEWLWLRWRWRKIFKKITLLWIMV